MIGVFAFAATAMTLLAPSVAAAASVPIWNVESRAQPTTFATQASLEENDRYLIQLTNVGTASSSGTVTVTDRLPAGVTVASHPFDALGRTEWSCAGSVGSTEVTCSSTETFEASAPDYNEKPGLVVSTPDPIAIPVAVAASAAGSLTNHVIVEGGGVSTGASTEPANPVNVPAGSGHGLSYLQTSLVNEVGQPFSQAGGHPYALTTDAAVQQQIVGGGTGIALETKENESYRFTGDYPRTVVAELPLGFIGNPQVTPRCPIQDLVRGENETACAADAQVGSVYRLSRFGIFGPYTVYNLKPEPGYAAQFGFVLSSIVFILDGTVVHTQAGYVLRVTASIPDAGIYNLTGFSLTFYGDPAAKFASTYTSAEAAEAKEAAFLTDSTHCAADEAERTMTVHADSWMASAGEPGKDLGDEEPLRVGEFTSPNWGVGTSVFAPLQAGSCKALSFTPTFSFAPSATSGGGTSGVDQPSGYTVNLAVPQTSLATELATPELKTATVTLPEGVTISPSSGAGLAGCTPGELGIEGSQQAWNEPGKCPLESKIGTAEVTTPLLPPEANGSGQLKGSVYLAAPKCDAEGQASSTCEAAAEDGELFGIYLEVAGVENAEHAPSIVVKLPGRVEVGAAGGRNGLKPGQVRAVFEDNPQLPFSSLKLSFTGGPRAPLANPQTCGSFATASVLEPWSAPETANASSSNDSPFTITGCGATMPFDPAAQFAAGTSSPAAGAYSPLSVSFGRRDGEQDLSGVNVQLPEGLLGKVAGVEKCAEAQANAATCGAGSQIGTVTVQAGPGSEPLTLGGRVYLTGPYHGDPFGLSIVVPANAGPFHLGNVVVRAAIAVDPTTAALSVVSNPLPQYVDGVQLRLRDVQVAIDRADFTRNATSCAAKQIAGSFTAAQGATGGASAAYYSSGCASLTFAPALTASTNGKTSHKAGASLTVEIAYPQQGEADIRRVHVQLPKQLPAREETLKNACPEATFDANPASCPPLALIGSAKAVTPLLNVPLEGPVYYVSHGGAKFPETVAVLQGEGITIDLAGETYISPKGIITSTFGAVPDAPVTSFEMTFPQGRDSVLSANANLCKGALKMPTVITGQNGAQIQQDTKISVTGCAPRKARRPLVKILKVKRKGRHLLVVLRTNTKGRLRLGGRGVREMTRKHLAPGRHRFKVKIKAQHPGKSRLEAKLVVGKHKAKQALSVKL